MKKSWNFTKLNLRWWRPTWWKIYFWLFKVSFLEFLISGFGLHPYFVKRGLKRLNLHWEREKRCNPSSRLHKYGRSTRFEHIPLSPIKRNKNTHSCENIFCIFDSAQLFHLIYKNIFKSFGFLFLHCFLLAKEAPFQSPIFIVFFCKILYNQALLTCNIWLVVTFLKNP